MATMRRRTANSEQVRMGPLALFTLVAVVCLSVLAVLALSTSNATLVLAERRATATHELYLDETAAQAFTAALDEALGRGTGASRALGQAKEAATDATDGAVQVSATERDGRYDASFDAGNGRLLNITLSHADDGSLRVDQWRMTSVENEEPPMGTLLGGK